MMSQKNSKLLLLQLFAGRQYLLLNPTAGGDFFFFDDPAFTEEIPALIGNTTCVSSLNENRGSSRSGEWGKAFCLINRTHFAGEEEMALSYSAFSPPQTSKQALITGGSVFLLVQTLFLQFTSGLMNDKPWRRRRQWGSMQMGATPPLNRSGLSIRLIAPINLRQKSGGTDVGVNFGRLGLYFWLALRIYIKSKKMCFDFESKTSLNLISGRWKKGRIHKSKLH